MRRATLAAAALVVLTVSCKKSRKNENPPPPPQPGTAKAKSPAKPPARVEGYAWIGADYRGVPIPLNKLATLEDAPYTAHFTAGGALSRLEERDTKGTVHKLWTFKRDKGGALIQIAHRPWPEASEERVTFKTTKGKLCARHFSSEGLEMSHRCWIRGAKTLTEENLNRFGRLEFTRKLTLDKRGRVRLARTFTRHGEFTGTEEFTATVTSGKLHNIYKKVQPLGAIAVWNETVLDGNGRRTAFIQRYADGSVKASTEYTWKSRYKAEGRAITTEGVPLKLFLETDRLRHRILERKVSGPKVADEERSWYDHVGRLVKRTRRDKKGRLLYQSEIRYNSRGLIREKRLYRGNIHNLICFDPKSRASVSSPLPAQERAVVTYDALGRVIELTRYYMDQMLDKEQVTYTPRGLVESRTVTYPKTGERETTRYAYNKAGRLAKQSYFKGGKAGEIITYAYNSRGMPVKRSVLKGDGSVPSSKELPDGSVVNYTYDKRGRVIEESWFHGDGTPALTTKSEGCSACRTDKKKAVARIVWQYDNNNLLTTITEYGLKKEILYTEHYTYSTKGQLVSHTKEWPREKRRQVLVTAYSPRGWIAATTMHVYAGKVEKAREERTFDRALLLTVARYKNGALVRKVTREYKGGLLAKRTVFEKGKEVQVTLTRNLSGLVTEERALDPKGKPAIAEDTWKNKYTNSLAQYSDQGHLVKLIYTDAMAKSTIESRFTYDKEGRQTGKKVFKNNNITMELREFFRDAAMARYGIFTSQVRTTYTGTKRAVSSYSITIDPKDIENSSATVTVEGKKPLKLTRCICQRCGVSQTFDQFSPL